MELTYQIFDPPQELKPYIRFYWVLEGLPSFVHRSMADACAELVFHYQGKFDKLNPKGSSAEGFTSIQGPCQQFSRYTTPGDFGIFGVYLFPHSLQDLLNLPPEGLSGLSLSLPDAMGQEGRDLESQILECPNNSARIQLISHYFYQKLGRLAKTATSESIFYAMQYCFANQGLVDIPHLARLSNLSRRQFERKFKAATGLSPKRFCQLLRFQATLKEYPHTKKSLVEIALEHGYYDQSHFIQEFKRFSGYTPRQWFLGEAEGQAYRELLH